MAAVCIEGVRKSFGDHLVVKGIDLRIADGEFCVFVGPSGCGKSTLLRLIAGLEPVGEGRIWIGERDVTHVAPANRGVAMVFQSYALYPHMTVFQNIGFGLRMARMPKEDIARRVAAAASTLQIGDLLDRKPEQLSGGQRQRVAIGRAIVREPAVFLFDEPLSNLDASLRVQMRLEISRLYQALRSTMIYVTHDQIEAMTMADRIVVLNAGAVEQVGSPLELYHRPRNLFVAGFIGSPKMNLLAGEVVGATDGRVLVRLPGGVTLPLPGHPDAVCRGTATVGVRPEHLSVTDRGDAALKGRLSLVERLGAETLLHVALEPGGTVTVRADGLTPERAGQPVEVGLPARACHLFDAAGRAVVNGSLI
jgi:multiple sugar transport system ATP-binding protein